MDSFTYVIIGGGLAGGRACQGIRKVDTEGSIALVTAEPHIPYQRPPLSKGYLTGKQGLDKVHVKDEAYYAQNGVKIIQGVRATRIDPGAHTITLDDGQEIAYGKLLLATGARAWRLPLPGADLEGVLTLRTIEDSDAIRAAAGSNARALVLGGSFVGSEVAASLAQLGADVTMVFPESRLIERIATPELSAYLHHKYEANGIRILTGTKPDRLEGGRRVERVVLNSGESIEVGLVVMGVGIRLNTELARDAGLEMGEQGAVIVDEALRTGDPDIYAAGDIAAWPDPTYGKRLRVEHWDVAWRQGMHVGRNMAGEQKPYTTLPYFFSDLFDLSFEVWGDLSSWDQTVRRGTVESGHFGFYYFSHGRMVGVLAVGRPDDERDPMQSLVKAQPTHDEVADQLSDEMAGLSAWVG